MKIIRTILIASAVPAIAGFLLFWKDAAYSVPSKYENKIIKKIDFVGMTKLDNGTIEYGQLINVSADELLANCKSYVGEPLRSEYLEEDLKNLSRAANLVDIRVYVREMGDGVQLTYYCEEGPVITSIELRGNSELKLEDVTSKLPFREGDPFRQDLLETGSRIILNTLIQDKGLFNAVVKHDYEYVDDSHKSVKILYTIDEGEEIQVGRISLLGLNKVYDSEVSSFLTTRAKGKLDQGDFKRDKFEEDKQKILMFYRTKGYLDAEITDEIIKLEWNNPEETTDRMLYITLKISEGERYYFEGYALEGNKIIPTEQITRQFQLYKDGMMSEAEGLVLDEGDVVFDDMKFQHDRMIVSMEYANIGHVFNRVNPEKKVITRQKKIGNKTVERKYLFYTFKISEGKPVNIETIIIKGNKKTKTKVIRREMVINEGELYSQAKLNLSRERIYATGFFKEVNIDIRPGSNDEKVNLVVSVVEQATGNITMGGGISTSSGFNLQAKVGESNFMGLGRKMEVSVEYGTENIATSLTFTEPWLMDYPVSFSSSIFYRLYQTETSTPYFDDVSSNDEYRQLSYGYSLGLFYHFWLYYGTGLKWTHTIKEITETSGNCSDEIMKVQAVGRQQKRQVTYSIYYNSTDHPLLTTKGLNIDLSAAVIGGTILGGNDHYNEYTVTGDYYFSPFSVPFVPKNRCVVELRGSGDFITPPFQRSQVAKMQDNSRDPWLDESDRLYVGGTESLRGWDYDDSYLPQSWQDKLFHRILYSAEFRIPIFYEYVWTAFFFDAGSLWGDPFWDGHSADEQATNIENDKQSGLLYDINDIGKADLMSYFKYSWGFGVRLQIPMMPLRFWWGQKLKWDGMDNGGFTRVNKKFSFQFTIGDIRF